jgi:ribonuclease Z
MDHFMGFDHLLRVFLPRDAEVDLYGPKGFLDCLAARLAGYTWNLTEEYALRLTGHEVTSENIRSATFPAATGFQQEDITERPFDGILVDEPAFTVRTAILDHKIPCLAFTVEEKMHLNVNTTALAERELKPGRWLEQLKQAIRTGSDDGQILTIPVQKNGAFSEKQMSVGSLRDLIIMTRGQKIGYVVDTLFSDANRDRIVNLVQGADVFYCESPFLDEDVDQATRRYHLTARQAGTLGRLAQVRRLEVFHFSPRYEGRAETIYAEARAAFQG